MGQYKIPQTKKQAVESKQTLSSRQTKQKNPTKNFGRV